MIRILGQRKVEMNKKWRRYAIICAISLVTPSAHAGSASIACEYGLLREAHEILLFCGEQIDEQNERRYQKLVGDLSSFIAANGKTSNHLASSAINESTEEIRNHLIREGQDRVCRSSDVPLALLRQSFLRTVSDVGVDELKKLLSRPQDPFEGDCL